MSQQFGWSFIEMIISLFLLSLALLGLDAMTLTALREAKTAYYYSVATQQILNMNERLSRIKSFPSADEIQSWNDENQEMLPNGKGTVERQFSHINITILWGEMSKAICDINKIGRSGCLHLTISI